uniref:Salutaridinol 7-O-acetyltransferase n=1 Tax=Opuntia streptacantha TaxID=393608 RepID=A0A7C9E6L5_OPUST
MMKMKKKTKTEMEIEMKIIISEKIKPSTPTPPHLKTHKLSLLDQFFSVCEYRTPSVLFYGGGGGSVSRLRDSLSKTLSLFYPLAGRLTADASAINCTDEGAPFFIARANCSLAAFLGSPNRVELVPHFIPNHAVEPNEMVTGLVPLILQVSVFDCGGVAIGCQVLHKVLDGTSRTHFFKTWAAVAAGRGSDVVPPDFTAAISLFPPVDHGPEQPPVQVLRPIEGGGCMAKAFGFSPAAITALQAKGRSETVPQPTRVESVSGFIWKHLMAAAVIPGPSVAIHAVDMRPQVRPPLPPTAYGKFTTHAIARYTNPVQALPDLSHLVAILHQAISEAKDRKAVSKFQGPGGQEAVHQHKQKLQKVKKEANASAYTFTSWNGLQVDFGFGMPLWIGFTGGPTTSWFRNLIPLIQTPGHGIEAWLILDEQEMANLESNPQFLAFAAPCSGSSIFAAQSSL